MRRRIRRSARTAALTVVSTVVWTAALAFGTGPASADGGPVSPAPSSDARYYRSSVLTVTPPAAGLDVVVAAGGAVTVTNRTGRDVVVLGYAGEPYLRLTASGMVLRNRDALTTALVAGRVPGRTAGAGGTPRVDWEHVSHEPAVTWADARVTWSGAARPPVVGQDEHAAHRVFDWALQLTVDGRPTVVHGAVDWTGIPAPAPDDRLPWGLVGAVLAVTLVAVGLLLRRTRAARGRRRHGRRVAGRGDAPPAIPATR